MCHKHFCMCHFKPSYTPLICLFFVAKVLNFALRLSYPIFAALIFALLSIQFDSIFVSSIFQESLKPDLLISNLNRTNSSSGDLNRVSYNDLCFPKISNYGSMKKKKHNVGVSTDNTMKMNGWKSRCKPNENRCQSFIITNQLVRLQ